MEVPLAVAGVSTLDLVSGENETESWAAGRCLAGAVLAALPGGFEGALAGGSVDALAGGLAGVLTGGFLFLTSRDFTSTSSSFISITFFRLLRCCLSV